MTRFVILALILCLCFPTAGSAQSLFPSLSTPEPAAVVVDKAPSYGSMANVDPDDVQPYAEGGQVVTYENVDEQGYQDFGIYLNGLGYEVVAQNVQGRTAELKLTNGQFNIGMMYYGDEQKMLLIYDEGVTYEESFVTKQKDFRSEPETISFSQLSFDSAVLTNNGTVSMFVNNELMEDWENVQAVAAGFNHILGLKMDGTVVAKGNNSDGAMDVSDWRDIVVLSAGSKFSIGLKKDGTVVATGMNNMGQCNVDDWKDIVSVSAGGEHTLGIRSDGTVIAVGDNQSGQCNVNDWRDIVQITAGIDFSVGLKRDGTVVAVGNNEDGQCNVGDWKDIVQVSAGAFHTVGLTSNGTVEAVGFNGHGQCDLNNPTDAVAVEAGLFETFMLRKDGTVISNQRDTILFKDVLVP